MDSTRRAVIARIPGRRAIDSVREFIPHAPETEIVAAAAAQEQTALSDHDGVVALPGADALLSALGDAGWAVVTSSPRDLATIRLKIAGLPHPPVLIAAEDVRAGKPDPEPYLTAAARLGVEPRVCVVFEDAPAGIAAARSAGMRVVALTTSHPAAEPVGRRGGLKPVGRAARSRRGLISRRAPVPTCRPTPPARRRRSTR